MDKYPPHKTFFVVLNEDVPRRPHAITIYEDDKQEDIYDFILDELSRQSGTYLPAMHSELPSLLVKNFFTSELDRDLLVTLDKIRYDMFSYGHTYVIELTEDKEEKEDKKDNVCPCLTQ